MFGIDLRLVIIFVATAIVAHGIREWGKQVITLLEQIRDNGTEQETSDGYNNVIKKTYKTDNESMSDKPLLNQ